MFYKKELKKVNQTEFRVEKVTKRKIINYIQNENVMIICLIAWQMRKISLFKMCQYFPKPQKHSNEKMKIELDLSNYATKTGLKRAAGVDTSNLGKK